MEKTADRPRPSVVRVYFPARNMTLSYYNDRFELKAGDYVYVEGKLAGQRGRVMQVNYNFKIKLSDYMKVVQKVDTDVKGRLYMAGSHFVTFEPSVLPPRKVQSWFMAADEEHYASGSDGTVFELDRLNSFPVSRQTAQKGTDYYHQNRVRYICVDKGRGMALVQGTQPYIIDFGLSGRTVSRLTCSCFCTGCCKHEYAFLLQLKETLDFIQENYIREYQECGYFAAVDKATFLTAVVAGRDSGSIILE